MESSVADYEIEKRLGPFLRKAEKLVYNILHKANIFSSSNPITFASIKIIML